MGVRFPRILTGVLLLLASASVAQAADYARQVHACRFLRMTAAERPECCDLALKDRFTRPGGDCCKSFTWEASEPAADVAHGHDVPLAFITQRLAWVAPRPAWTSLEAPSPFARGPPPLPIATKTIVLRI